jgi:hypothetical protein
MGNQPGSYRSVTAILNGFERSTGQTSGNPESLGNPWKSGNPEILGNPREVGKIKIGFFYVKIR